MYLSIVGDVLGSSLEFQMVKPKMDEVSLTKLALWGRPTDDSVMTLATWKWWMDYREGKAEVKDYISYLRRFFDLTPRIGYGGMFFRLMAYGEEPNPPSCGNGAAMRISALGMSSGYSMDDMMDLVEKITIQTHKHPEGVKGARAVVYAIKKKRMRVPDSEVIKDIERVFGYDLDLDYDELCSRSFNATCQGSVPQALWCALTSDTASGMFKKALSIGGDTDTIACIAGGVFQAGHSIDVYGDAKLAIGIASMKALMLPTPVRKVFVESLVRYGFDGQLF